jgi:hypothetical protein
MTEPSLTTAPPAASPPKPTAPAAPGGRWLLEIVAFLVLVLGFVAVARAWPDLPETVPTHFGLSGEPDGWGSRKVLLLLPGASLLLYLVLSAVQLIPARFYNFPVALDDENRERQYRLAKGLILGLKAAVTGLFAHLTVQVLRVALGHSDGLGPWLVFGWLAVVFGLVGVYLARALRAR